MKKDKVIFLMERPEPGARPEVFAYFPEIPGTLDPKVKTCYAHTGQHSACHEDYAKECEEAAPEQYAELKTELTQVGYNLKVLNQQPQP